MFVPLLKKGISYFFVAICVVNFGCKKQTEAPTESTSQPVDSLITYIIQKGNHYSDQSVLQLMNKPAITADVTFDSSAIYKSVDPVNQADVNKLMGFSDCGSEHQQNSARLGWSWNGTALILYAYAYVNSVRVIKTLGPVPLEKPITCSVKAKANYYYFSALSYTDSIPRHCAGYVESGYKLYPYFGGDETAPHDIRIKIYEMRE